MDLAPDEPGSADAVIDYGGLLDTDTENAQKAWNAMCGHAVREVRAEFLTDVDSPDSAHVLEWALNVSCLFLRTKEQGGLATFQPDGTIQPGLSATSAQLRTRRGILGPAANPRARVAIIGG